MIGGYLTVYGMLMYYVSGHSTGYRCVVVSTRGRGVRALRGGWCGADDQRWHLLVSVAAIANPHRTHLYRPTAAGSHATSNDTLWHLTYRVTLFGLCVYVLALFFVGPIAVRAF